MRRRRQLKTGPRKGPLPAAARGMRKHKERGDEEPPEVQNRLAPVAANVTNHKRRERAVKDGRCRGRERGTAGPRACEHGRARARCTSWRQRRPGKRTRCAYGRFGGTCHCRCTWS
jgi:hypothetical protein